MTLNAGNSHIGLYVRLYVVSTNVQQCGISGVQKIKLRYRPERQAGRPEAIRLG
jgi:hypothetical protein